MLCQHILQSMLNCVLSLDKPPNTNEIRFTIHLPPLTFLLDPSPGHRPPLNDQIWLCNTPWEVVFTVMVPAPRPAGSYLQTGRTAAQCWIGLWWEPYTPILHTMYTMTLPWSGIAGTVLMMRLLPTYPKMGDRDTELWIQSQSQNWRLHLCVMRLCSTRYKHVKYLAPGVEEEGQLSTTAQ